MALGAGGGASRAAHSGSPVCGVCLGGWSCPSRAQLAVSALSWPSASCSSAPPRLLDVPTRPQRESAVRGLRDRWPSLQVAVPVLTLRLWADDSAGCQLRGQRERHLSGVCFLTGPCPQRPLPTAEKRPAAPRQPGSEQPGRCPGEQKPPWHQALGAPAGSGAGPGRCSERGGGRQWGRGVLGCSRGPHGGHAGQGWAPALSPRTAPRESAAASGGIIRSPWCDPATQSQPPYDVQRPVPCVQKTSSC